MEARYSVIAHDGKIYGPADLDGLRQWAIDGRLTPATLLIDPNGAQIPAAAIPGLFEGYATSDDRPYAAYPRAGRFGASQSQPRSSNDLIIAWVSGAGSIFLCSCGGPILGGSIGLYFALRAQKKGEGGARAAVIFNLCVLILGLGFLLWLVGSMG
ncbi:MAG: hypothetical protein HYR64_03030 [Fimbriimonas ginsengisoli]|uniref:DUF4339 domain-containing protein n=1 Tax=Fimbriimonas ginsengisoli TaxID=1005039 RepID=A0A931LRI8_FIMGI|nr:hypothetical protein [Fimbriimonas ginsengisoli]